MPYLSHETLDVRQASIDFVAQANEVAASLPRGRAYLADQLRRAATSVPLDIAEGVGEHVAKERARFYRMAKRSATECAAVLGVCRRLEISDPEMLDAIRENLLRVVSMPTRVIQGKEGLGAGTEP